MQKASRRYTEKRQSQDTMQRRLRVIWLLEKSGSCFLHSTEMQSSREGEAYSSPFLSNTAAKVQHCKVPVLFNPPPRWFLNICESVLALVNLWSLLDPLIVSHPHNPGQHGEHCQVESVVRFRGSENSIELIETKQRIFRRFQSGHLSHNI